MFYRSQSVPCPVCAGTLQHNDELGVDCLRCPECFGAWIEDDAFFSALRRRHPEARVTEVMVHNDGSPRIVCPFCSQKMDIGWLDFLQVDSCAEHGLWFEDAELERALAYEIGQDVVALVKKRAARRRNARGAKHKL